MNRISTRQRLLAVLLLPVLLVLAGCGKFHADLEVKDADTINAAFDIAMDEEFAAGSWSSAEEFCGDMEGQTTFDADAPTVEPYEADGRFGCTITGVITSDNFDSEFNLTEEDGEFHLVIAPEDATSTDFSEIEDLGLDIDFRMTVTFPGEIIESSGGEIDGTSVTFTEISDLAGGIDIRAEAGGSFPWVIVLVIVLVLGFLLLLVLAAVAFFVVRARRNKTTGSTPAGMPGGYGGAAGTGSPVPPAPQGQQWGQASPPPAPPQGQQPWSQPPQQGDPQWGQGDQGQQPPRSPGW